MSNYTLDPETIAELMVVGRMKARERIQADVDRQILQAEQYRTAIDQLLEEQGELVEQYILASNEYTMSIINKPRTADTRTLVRAEMAAFDKLKANITSEGALYALANGISTAFHDMRHGIEPESGRTEEE